MRSRISGAVRDGDESPCIIARNKTADKIGIRTPSYTSCEAFRGIFSVTTMCTLLANPWSLRNRCDTGRAASRYVRCRGQLPNVGAKTVAKQQKSGDFLAACVQFGQTMNTATNAKQAETESHDGVNGRNGSRNGRIAIHELPVLDTRSGPRIVPAARPLSLPVPVFPRHPEKAGNVEPDPKFLPRDGNPYRTRVTVPMVARALRGWLVPYVGSRVKPRRVSSDHFLPVYRMEVQSRLPLLLGIRQSRQGHDRRHCAPLDRLASRYRLPGTCADGRRGPAAAGFRAQGGRLRRPEGLLGLRPDQRTTDASAR